MFNLCLINVLMYAMWMEKLNRSQFNQRAKRKLKVNEAMNANAEIQCLCVLLIVLIDYERKMC